jgi:hypothetical protein
LFAAFTKIAFANEQIAKFWKDMWLNGSTPAEVAPLLFRLARGKSISVVEVINSNEQWLWGLSRISSEELRQFL